MADEQTAEQLIEEAELRQAVAEAERAEALARKARYDARASAGETGSQSRTGADDRSGYPATLAAYQAMVQIAGDVARAVEGQCGPGNAARILIVDSLDFCGADVQSIQVSAQLDFWLAELETWTAAVDRMIQQVAERVRPDRTAAVAAAGGVAAAAGAVAEVAALGVDIVGYFRTGYDVRGQAVSLPDAALRSLVAGHLDKQRCSVFLPAFHRLDSGAIPVVEKLNECIRRKDRLKQQVAALRGLSAVQKAQGPESESDAKDNSRGQAAEIEAACKKAELVIGEFAELNEALTTAPRSGGYPPLVAAAIRHYLDRMQITHLLHLGVASTGGDMVLGRGLFGAGKAGYLGGCVITYVLARTSGEILAADTVTGHRTLKYELGGNRLSGSTLG